MWFGLCGKGREERERREEGKEEGGKEEGEERREKRERREERKRERRGGKRGRGESGEEWGGGGGYVNGSSFRPAVSVTGVCMCGVILSHLLTTPDITLWMTLEVSATEEREGDSQSFHAVQGIV